MSKKKTLAALALAWLYRQMSKETITLFLLCDEATARAVAHDLTKKQPDQVFRIYYRENDRDEWRPLR